MQQIIAKKLKILRKQQGWSLDKTADITGVSKAMLGQIERGESSPTLNTLWKIVNGFDISFSSFINDTQTDTKQPLSSLKQGEQLLLESLFPYDATTKMEMYRFTLAPQTEHSSLAHGDGVIEYLYILQGTLDVWCDNAWHELKSGDKLSFNADQLHSYVNNQNNDCVVINTLCYSKQGKNNAG